ncbi:MAG: mobilization protein, partial [Tannerellaceae bacterium]|nr:mobilization protein [Tannerellaceae bacterium]
ITPPIIVDSKLRPIDLMHFGWNVGNQFKKSGIEIATFIKHVFAKTLKGYEISTLQRKLRAEGNCIIKNKEEL